MPGTGLYYTKTAPAHNDDTQSGAPAGQVITLVTGGLGVADAWKGGYIKNNAAGWELAESDYQPTATGSPTEGHAWAASSEYTANYAWKAADDNLGTVWRAAGAAPQWWEYTPPSPVIFAKVNIRAAYNGSQLGPENFTIEGFDGDDWVVLRTVVGETGWAANELREFAFDNETPYSKYRLYITKAEYDWPTMTETEWFELVPMSETRAIVSHMDDTVTLEGDLSNWLDGHDLDIYDAWATIQAALDQLWIDLGVEIFTANQYVRVFAGTYVENLAPNAGLLPDTTNGYLLVIEGDPADDRENIKLDPANGHAIELGCDQIRVKHMWIDVTSAAYCLYTTATCWITEVLDCKLTGVASVGLVRAANGAHIEDCEMTLSGNGRAYYSARSACTIKSCKMIGPGKAASAVAALRVDKYYALSPTIVEGCVISGFEYGVEIADNAANGVWLLNTTFHDCTVAIKSDKATLAPQQVVNCIFEDCTYNYQVLTWPEETATQTGPAFIQRNNCYHGYTNFAYDGSATKTYAEWSAYAQVDAAGELDAIDPLLTNPGGGDFSLQIGSKCRHAGHGSGVTKDVNGDIFDPYHPDMGGVSTGIGPNVAYSG